MLHQLLARKPIEPEGHVDAGEPVEGSLEGEAAVLACLYLFWQPFVEHWRIFVGWTLFGLVVYFGYGYRHSRLRAGLKDREAQ